VVSAAAKPLLSAGGGRGGWPCQHSTAHAVGSDSSECVEEKAQSPGPKRAEALGT
jgi:hypothetical protein